MRVRSHNKNCHWTWGVDQETAFQKVKEMRSSDCCIALYDPSFPTVVSADASSYGIGTVLLQSQPCGARRAVAFASRSLTPTEARYSQTEKETLAITWAITRFDQYLRGLFFTVESDHQPLVALLRHKDLDQLPPRIQRMRIKLMRYQFQVKYVPGKLLATADTLSRAPCDAAPPKLVSAVELVIWDVYKGFSEPVASRLEEIRQAQLHNEECQAVIGFIENGWPDKSKVPVHVMPFWKERARLSIFNGVILLDRRLVIPRANLLALLHDGHQGLRRCKERARGSVWWPGCNMQIQHTVTSCQQCASNRVVNPEPLMPTATPDRPWQHLAIDLFHCKSREHLVVVDYYSRFPEVVSLSSTTSMAVINAVKSCFARHGIPDVVRTDNGPQFSSNEFATFAQTYGFRHETSSPRYPQSNGEAERMVRTVKNLLEKSDDPYLALLSYRDTPGPSGFSPAQLLMGRRLQTRLPSLPERLSPRTPSHREFKNRDAAYKAQQAKAFNSRHRASLLPPLTAGDHVWVKDLNCPATLLSPAQRPRSFVVETPRGVVQRNRRHLVRFVPDVSQDSKSQEGEERTGRSPTSGTFSVPDSARSPGLYRTRSGRVVRPPQRLNL